MTVREVAERLEISTPLVYKLVAHGKLRCSRHGIGRGVIRVSEVQLADYLASVERGDKGIDSRVPRARLKHLRL